VHIETTRFGSMEIDEGMIIHFPSGLFGFPENKNYVIFDHDQDIPFQWLQAVDEPDLAFVIMDPFDVLPDYQAEIQDPDLLELKVNDSTNLSLFVIITIPTGGPMGLTANLKGPVLVNSENRWAKQLVLANSPYTTCHPLFAIPSNAE
jgi:flagellar assembly factor FliW